MAAISNPEWLALIDDEQLRAEYVRRGPAGTLKLIESVTDDALRAECERRKLISGDLAIVDLVRASDEALRNEYEHRGMHRGIAFDVMEAERDEWKRRAEKAEANVYKLAMEHPANVENKKLLDAELAEIERKTKSAPRFRRTLSALACETGPGIAATRPDNSIAHLDEDLLCDDA